MNNEKEIRTELSELGEFGLIEALTSQIQLKNTSTLKGVGDDAAVVQYEKGNTLISKDLLIEGVHFDLTYTPLKHLGYKAAVVNFSDIVAMNGVPKQLLIGIGASNRFSLESIEEIYKGIYWHAKGIRLISGWRYCSSNSGLVISVLYWVRQHQRTLLQKYCKTRRPHICFG